MIALEKFIRSLLAYIRVLLVVGDEHLGRQPAELSCVHLEREVEAIPDVGADAGDPGAHLAQEERQVDDVRLPGGVVNCSDALGRGGRHHQVLGTRDRRHIEDDGGGVQSFRASHVLSVFQVHRGAHLAQTGHVLLDPSHADVVAPRLGDPGLAPPREQWPHQQKGGPHPACHRGQHIAVRQPRGIDLQLVRIEPANIDPHGHQQLRHRVDVLNARHVFDPALFVREEASGQDGKHSIFGASNPDGPREPLLALNDHALH